jgi:hypothetical protein
MEGPSVRADADANAMAEDSSADDRRGCVRDARARTRFSPLVRRALRVQATEPGASQRSGRPHARRAQCDRSGLLLRIDVRRSGRAVEMEAHVASCSQCRQELETLRPVADSFVFWPRDVLRPRTSLRERFARRIAAEGENPVVPPAPGRQWNEPAWEEVAPGIFCKLMALPRRLQPGRGWLRRQASVERDRLHLRAHYKYSRHSWILSRRARSRRRGVRRGGDILELVARR